MKFDLFGPEIDELIAKAEEIKLKPETSVSVVSVKTPKKKEPKPKPIKSYTELIWEYRKVCKAIKDLPLNPARNFVLNPNEVIIVDTNLIMREDLRDIIFKEGKEDEVGRYRERIWDMIQKFGVENWFKAKGYPTNPDSIWKNRYVGSEIRMDIEVSNGRTLQEQGYLLWENYMPKELWTAELSNELSELKRKAEEYAKTIAEGRSKFLPVLNEWKEYIITLCKEKGHEIDKIWFDESAPYDCEVAVRLKEHDCYHSCVQFRFSGSVLRAYDSHFGGGTSFVNQPHQTFLEAKATITEVMEKVFEKKCSSSGWNFDKDTSKAYEQRKININDYGWLEDD